MMDTQPDVSPEAVERMARHLEMGLHDGCAAAWQEAADVLRALSSQLEARDREWILAMAAALGTDSGFHVPIVPKPAPFKELFAQIRGAAMAASAGGSNG